MPGLVATIVVAFAALVAGGYAVNEYSKHASQDELPIDGATATAAAQLWVKECLHAPRDAEFRETSCVSLRKASGFPGWRVKGKVDAQNALGVYLRLAYDCEVEYVRETDQFVLIYLVLGDTLYHLDPKTEQRLKRAFEKFKSPPDEERPKERRSLGDMTA